MRSDASKARIFELVTAAAEVRRVDRVRAAVRLGAHLAERLERCLDLGRRPRLRAGHPLVVDVRPGLAEDEVLDPVGARPTRGRARLEREAPRLRVPTG